MFVVLDFNKYVIVEKFMVFLIEDVDLMIKKVREKKKVFGVCL